MSELLKHIKEYFNTFNQKDYTIYVDGTPTEWCDLNDYSTYIVWRILSDNNELNFINVCDLEAIKLTPTTIKIIKTTGKEHKIAAKLKTKEEKAKEIIFKAKMALRTHHYDDVPKYLNKLNALIDELTQRD